jgi:hypothetical protein
MWTATARKLTFFACKRKPSSYGALAAKRLRSALGRGSRRFHNVRLTDRFAQIRPACLVISRACETVKIDGHILGLLEFGEPDGRIQNTCAHGRSPTEQLAERQANRIRHLVDDKPGRIAPGGRSEIGEHNIGTGGNAPDKQCLAEITALLRQARLTRNIEKAAKAD